MNNDLEQFTEEMLKDMQKHVTAGMTLGHADALLIRQAIDIALAAKQAKPVAWITWHQGCRAPDDCEDYLNAYTYKTEEKSVDGSDAFPVYATPQPAHTGQDGCQWNPDEDSVYSTGCGNEWQFTDGGLEDNKIKFCPYCSGKIAAPKPESE